MVMCIACMHSWHVTWHMAEEAGRKFSPPFDVVDSTEEGSPNNTKMSVLEKLIDEEGCKRSVSPPGRQDWRAGERSRDDASPGIEKGAGQSRSRSRSRSPATKRGSSRDRQNRYEQEGSNTTRDEPHLKRARLFVGNIEPDKVHRRDLIRLFSEYGDVLGVSVHKGYAFVQMDRERNANKAVNYLDNRTFMGSQIHVEFSQAALKAGARIERLPPRRAASPPPPVRAPPPVRDRPSDPYPALLSLERDHDLLREREERLSRILQMEKELLVLRNREEVYDPVPRRSRFDQPLDRGPPPSVSYRRASPPPPVVAREYPSARPPQHSGYSLNGSEERRSLYSRPTDRGLDRPFERPPSPPVHREPISYPQPGISRLSSSGSNLDRRDGFSSQYGNSSYGFSQRSGGGPSLPSANVGYGGGGIGRAMDPGKPVGHSSGAPPPGWPSTDYNVNRAPFASTSRWS